MADTLFDISDRVIWVTGSSRGVGRGVAEHLAAHGAAVVVYARRPEALEEVMAALHALGAPALAVTADVRDEASVADAVAAIDTRFARLDGGHRKRGRRSLRSGGVARARQVPKAARPESHRRLHHGQSAYLRLLASRGAAVLIYATAATKPTPQFAAYGAAKAATEHLTRSLAEWGPEVRVNCVSPELIRTEGSLKSVFGGSEDLVARAGRTTAVGRIGEPRDIAQACQYLLSDAAASCRARCCWWTADQPRDRHSASIAPWRTTDERAER